MTLYEVSSEPFEECAEYIDGYPRYETTAFYELIEAESRSKARYQALKKLGISDFRCAPKLSVRIYRKEEDDDDAMQYYEEEVKRFSVTIAQEVERTDKEMKLLEEKVVNLTNQLSTLEHKAHYYERKYLSLSSKVRKLVPYRGIRELLGLT